MKFKFLIIPIILIAFSCQNTTKENTKQEDVATEEVTLANAIKVEINIEGMTCTGCENTIQNKINEFDGVYSAKADYEKGVAILEMDSLKVEISKIEEAINEVGYKATGHKKISE